MQRGEFVAADKKADKEADSSSREQTKIVPDTEPHNCLHASKVLRRRNKGWPSATATYTALRKAAAGGILVPGSGHSQCADAVCEVHLQCIALVHWERARAEMLHFKEMQRFPASGLQAGQEQQPLPSAAGAADASCPQQPSMSNQAPQISSDLQLLWEAAQAAMAEAEDPQTDSMQHQRPDQAPPEHMQHDKAPCSSTFSVPSISAASTAHHHFRAIPAQGQGMLVQGPSSIQKHTLRQWHSSRDQQGRDSFALVTGSADQQSQPVPTEQHQSSSRAHAVAQSEPMSGPQSDAACMQQSQAMLRHKNSSRDQQTSAGDSIARALQRLGSMAPSQGTRTLPRLGSMAPSQATEGAGQRRAGPRGVQPLLGETTLNMLQVRPPSPWQDLNIQSCAHARLL